MSEFYPRFLSACIRPQLSPCGVSRVVDLAAEVEDWPGLIEKAEMQGMAPLLYHVLKQSGVSLRAAEQETLKALVLRHRLINQTRCELLKTLYDRCTGAGLPVLTLKGAALAYILYPQPALRAMRDIDLLIDPQLYAALADLLTTLGFSASHLPADQVKDHRHYSPWLKMMDGFTISVEVHHSLLADSRGKPWFQVKDLYCPPRQFYLGEGMALTLGHEDMLFNLCANAFRQGLDLTPCKLIQIADIINYAERYSAEIDWGEIRRRYPLVLHILALLHLWIPLADELVSQAALHARPVLRGCGASYAGWPVHALKDMRSIGMQKLAQETFFPSPWWLALRYGDYARRRPEIVLWGKYLADLARMIGMRAVEKLGGS